MSRRAFPPACSHPVLALAGRHWQWPPCPLSPCPSHPPTRPSHASAEQWADALHRWLGITEERVHVVHSHKDAERWPPACKFLIVSYNFVPKMSKVRRRGEAPLLIFPSFCA